MISLFHSHLKNKPSNLTSYDILKSIAIFLMIIDHIGYYFYPDIEVYRAIGRLCIPIWGFLIGYSLSDKKDPRLLIGTAILALNAYVIGDYIIPLTILMTFYLCRCILPIIQDKIAKDGEILLIVMLGLLALHLPANFIVQYGTQILTYAIAGRLYKLSQAEMIDVSKFKIIATFITANIFYFVFQVWAFRFQPDVTTFLLIGLTVIMIYILRFKAKTYAENALKKLSPLKHLLMFTGRWTLEIYVLNLISFGIISNMMDIGNRQWFTIILPNIPGL